MNANKRYLYYALIAMMILMLIVAFIEGDYAAAAPSGIALIPLVNELRLEGTENTEDEDETDE